MNLNTPLRRVLYGSPLHRTSGKIAVGGDSDRPIRVRGPEF